MIASDDASWTSQFQEAALDPSRWLTVLQELADATGSTRAELVGVGGPGFVPFNWVTSTDERTLSDFVAAGGPSPDHNYRMAADDGRSVMTLVDEGTYDAVIPTLRSTDFVDFCEEYEMVFGCQTVLAREQGGLVGLSLLRSRREGRTDAAVHRTFGSAAKAAQAAVRMQRAIEQQGYRLLSGTLEAMTLPCLLLDGFGSVRAATGPAEALLAANPAVAIAGGRLCAADPRIARRLDCAIRSVLEPAGNPHIRVLVGKGALPDLVLNLFALPAGEWSLPFAPRLLVVLRDPAARRADAAAALIAAFGLTSAEADIALLLSAGVSREQVARRRNVSAETLRTQLRTLYSKTGCARETELVLLVKAMVD